MRKPLSSWIDVIVQPGSRKRGRGVACSRKPRRLRHEPLESRNMLAADFVVTTLADELNFSNADLSLREAIILSANDGTSTNNTIEFAPALFTAGPKTLTLTYDDPVDLDTAPEELMLNAVTISGPGADLLAINGNNQTRVLYLPSGIAASLSGVTIRNGNSFGDTNYYGGAIYSAGTLTIDGCEVINSSGYGYGGGIYAAYGSTLTVTNSTIAGNFCYSGGGGIYMQGNVVATLQNNTISGNSTYSPGGGVFVGPTGVATLINNTITGNSSAYGQGGGIYNDLATVTLHNNIIAQNTATGNVDLRGSFDSSSSYNFIGSDGVTGNGIDDDPLLVGNLNQVGGEGLAPAKNPQLMPLGLYGGTTRTHALKSGSTAIDGGIYYYASSYDQRGEGYSRSVGYSVDIGAFESGNGVQLVVNTLTDEKDTLGPANYMTDLSLREALALIPLLPATEDVKITFAVTGQITLGTSVGLGPLGIATGVAIEGPGAGLLTIDGGSNSGVLGVAGADVSISGVKIRGGLTQGAVHLSSGSLTLDQVYVTGGYAVDAGGGVNATGGELTLVDSTIDDNYGDFAGGIYVDGASLHMTGTTVSNNTAGPLTGGVHFLGSQSLYILNSTISGNDGFDVGGITISGSGTHEILHSTITDNTAYRDEWNYGYVGGLLATGTGTTVDMHHTILAGNRFTDDGDSDVVMLGGGRPPAPPAQFTAEISYNIIGYDPDQTNGLDHSYSAFPFNQVGGELGGPSLINPQLGPLADNGGPTLTHALLSGSPAINAGDSYTWYADDDQRGYGFDRLIGPNLDIGAYEYSAKLYIDDVIAVEGTSAKVYFTLSEALPYAVSIYYSTVNDSATHESNDYQNSSGYVNFAAYQTEEFIEIPVYNNDSLIEGDEYFRVAIDPAYTSVTLGERYGVVRIIDDLSWIYSGESSLTGVNTISVGVPGRNEKPDTQSEAFHGVSIPIAIPPSTGSYDVQFNASLATWDSYNPEVDDQTGYWDSFSISVTPRPLLQWISGPPAKSDPLDQYDNVGFLWGGTLFDDGVPEFYATSSPQWTTSMNPSDLSPKGNYLNVGLDTHTDDGISADENFPSWGTFEILQVNYPGKFSGVRVKDVAYSESNSRVYVVVELGDITSKTVQVSYATANGTATATNDYVAKSGTLSFAGGQRLGLIEIQLAKDSVFEGTEHFLINLSNPVNTTINDSQAVVTLYDDDYSYLVEGVNGGGGLVESPTTDFEIDRLSGTLKQTAEEIDMRHGSVMLGTPMELFQTAHQGGTWNFAAVNGATYEVRLYFAEIDPAVTSVGGRVFDVLAEGSVKLNDFDIFQEAGGRYKAVMKSFTVTAVGSQLTIDFVGVIGNPLISAIEIIQV